MRLRRASSVVAVLCLSGAVLAEAQSHGKTTEFGVLGGLTFSKPSGADADIFNSTATGFSVGGFARIGVGRNFAVQPEVFFAQKGGKFSATEVGSATTRISYVEVPVLLTARFPSGGQITPRLYAGPAIGIKTGCSVSASGGGTSIGSSCTEAELTAKSTDFGILVGGGLDIGRALLEVRYDLGLTKIDDSSTPVDVKNRTFFVLVGYRFGGRH